MEFNIDTVDWKNIIEEIIEGLPLNNENVKVFDSEYQLQLLLAQKLNEIYPSIKIFLEGTFFSEEMMNSPLKRDRVDIIILDTDSKFYPIELKYRYRAKSPGGQNNLQYGYLYDIHKIEQMQKRKNCGSGYCIFLSNMTCLYNKPKRKTDDCKCKDCRIYDGIIIEPDRDYNINSDKHKRENLNFKNFYTMCWSENLRIDGLPENFKLLVTKIKI